MGGAFSSFGTHTVSFITNFDTFTPVMTEVIDLSSITYADSVEIRIAMGDNSGSPGKSTFLQGIQLEGDVAPIPEPATMAMLGLAFAGLGGYVRKRKGL